MVKNILLIDDDPDELMIFEEAVNLVDSSVKVQMVSQPVDLQDCVSHSKPDLVFLDINMNKLNGFGWLDLIRFRGYRFPVVMYSNSSDKNDIERAYRGGATIYLTKPVNFSVLVKCLESLFSMDLNDPKQVQEKYSSNGNFKIFEL